MASMYELQVAVVAGAAAFSKYKREHPNASDEEALGHVTMNASEILRKMKDEKF